MGGPGSGPRPGSGKRHSPKNLVTTGTKKVSTKTMKSNWQSNNPWTSGRRIPPMEGSRSRVLKSKK